MKQKIYNPDITEILRDIADGKTNICGDHWHPSYCEEAAKEIERLRAQLESREYLLHCIKDAADTDPLTVQIIEKNLSNEAAKEIERLRNEIEGMHEDAAGESI